MWLYPYFFVSLQRQNYKKPMTAIALKQETDNYWELIKGASNEVKQALVKRLNNALRTTVTNKSKRKYTADDFAGIWSDEEFMDADELVKTIRDARHVKSSRNTCWRV